jgi:hypothetical protein
MLHKKALAKFFREPKKSCQRNTVHDSAREACTRAPVQLMRSHSGSQNEEPKNRKESLSKSIEEHYLVTAFSNSKAQTNCRASSMLQMKEASVK